MAVLKFPTFLRLSSNLGSPMRRPATKAKPAPTRAATPVMARPRFPVWLMAVLLVLVTMALYWPATRYDFVNYDDDLLRHRECSRPKRTDLGKPEMGFLEPGVPPIGIPLTVLSHMLDCQLFGLKPWGHHLTSVLLHALNAALVFALLRQMTGATWRSLLVAALFAVHPLRVESVAWVAERKDVLSGFFGLLALMCLRPLRAKARGQKAEVQKSGSQQSAVTSASPHAPRFHASIFSPSFFFALGLMSKPMLVTWPFVMLLLDYWPLRRFEPLNSQLSTLNALAPGEGEDPVLCPRGGGERRDLRGAEARRRCGGG